MFDTLSDRLDGVFKKLRSRGKLHPKQVDNALAEIRTALLEADVSVEVADDLLARVRARALSEEVLKSLTPAQQVVKVMDEELTVTLGGEHHPFTLSGASPAVIMLAGVQGSGKTTACAKLAKHLKGKGRRPLLIAADLERPAAVEQLRTLGREIGVPVWSEGRDPVRLAKNGVKEAQRTGADVVIIDTAGRLHEATARGDGVRRDDGSRRRHPGAGVHARGRHDWIHLDETRRRRPWWRGAVDDRGHGPAGLLRGDGREGG
jgi:signal recognition particle subunit SRP54